MSTPAKQTLPKLTLYAHLFNDIQKGIIQSVKVTISSEISARCSISFLK